MKLTILSNQYSNKETPLKGLLKKKKKYFIYWMGPKSLLHIFSSEWIWNFFNSIWNWFQFYLKSMKSLVLNPSLPFETTSPGRFHWYINYIWNDFNSIWNQMICLTLEISNRIEIISNIIEINVISRVNATITIWNHFASVDFFDFNYIWNDFNSIWNQMMGLTLRFQIELKSFQI